MGSSYKPQRLPVYIDRANNRWLARPYDGGPWFVVTPSGGGGGGGGSVPPASTTTPGIVQLDDSVSSTSTSMAATPNAVRQAFSLAESANTTATSATNTANSAQASATSALNTANSSNATATQAGIDAGNALTAANSANATANSALSSVNSRLPLSGGTLTGDLFLGAGARLYFEGTTDDNFETLLAVTNPTIDQTITLPDASGTVALLEVSQNWGGTQSFSAMNCTGQFYLGPSGSLVFEGSTDNEFETTLAVANPTADRTVTFPDASGTVPFPDRAQTWTAAQTFNSNLRVGSSGTLSFQNASNAFETSLSFAAPASANQVISFPNTGGTVGLLGLAQTWTGTQSFNTAYIPTSGELQIFNGANLRFWSGASSTVLNTAALSASRTITLPDASGTVALLAANTWSAAQTFNATVNLGQNVALSFEGSVVDANRTNLGVINPTATRTINLPDASGTVALVTGNTWTGAQVFQGQVLIDTAGSLVFEGGAGAGKTTLAVSGPAADRTITLPDASGSVVLSGLATGSGLTSNTQRLLGRATAATGAIEEISLGTGLSFAGTTLNYTIGSGVISDANVAAGAAIADTKLATISTAGKVSGTAITSGNINTSGSFTTSSNVSTSAGNISATGASSVINGTAIGVNQASPVTKLDLNGNYSCNVTAVAALDINCSLGNFFTKTINGASTFTFSNVPASRAYSFTLELIHQSGAITWPASVRWPRNTAPSLTTGATVTHLFMFVTDDGGTTWRGAALVSYAS